MAKDFDGELSARGIKHAIKSREKQRIKQENQLLSNQQAKLAPNSIPEKNNKMMENAKKLERYDYLNRTINPYPSTRLANATTNSTDIANRSLAQIIAQRGNKYNSSIISRDSTILNTSFMSNNSIPNGFGRGVVQESTPNTSFKRNFMEDAENSTGANDDKLTKLRRLTASIKDKYHKKDSKDK
ncbi:SAC3 [Candida metapsilosis]|uniref:SAC3 n=1 Tax=Candida metapsilosis TaxID=273372 RepID=A0A8H7ZBK1_9ASCO|nr:SAC3 [Candida metapsilosis]